VETATAPQPSPRPDDHAKPRPDLSEATGRPAEAHDLLDPFYIWFAEGFDTPDLKEAKALLDEFSGG
jgi:hypothetical protein